MLFTLNGRMGRPWIAQQIMVLFGYGLIWTWFYLGFDQKCPAKKWNPFGHTQTRPTRPFDISTDKSQKQLRALHSIAFQSC